MHIFSNAIRFSGKTAYTAAINGIDKNRKLPLDFADEVKELFKNVEKIIDAHTLLVFFSIHVHVVGGKKEYGVFLALYFDWVKKMSAGDTSRVPALTFVGVAWLPQEVRITMSLIAEKF